MRRCRLAVPAYFNPRSPHGERPGWCCLCRGSWRISIHAPRTGSDPANAAIRRAVSRFQSTLPARGATGCSIGCFLTQLIFQSTLPARGATSSKSSRMPVFSNFNPRSPHGERPMRIAALSPRWLHFNPRSPHGERLATVHSDFGGVRISIHAPRTGSDSRVR